MNRIYLGNSIFMEVDGMGNVILTESNDADGKQITLDPDVLKELLINLNKFNLLHIPLP